MRGNCHSADVQRGIVGIGTLHRQEETVGRHFWQVMIRLASLWCFCFLFRLHQPRLVVVVVAFEELLTHRNELALAALHLLVQVGMVLPNVHFYAHGLNGTVIAPLALVRLLGRVTQRVLSHYARVSGIKGANFAFQRLFT